MKKWVWIVLAVVVIGGAAAGVLYGVLMHTEPGLMKVCWAESGQAYYGHPDCEHELRWKKIPITYYIAFGKDHKDYIDSVVEGAVLWNKEIGVELLKRVDKDADAVVQVVWGSVPKEGDAGGHTSHTGSPDGPTGAKVVLSDPSDVHAVYRYAAHEWGHVLGLEHDEAPRSIMYPVQPGMTKEMTFVLPSDHDKKLLQGIYKK